MLDKRLPITQEAELLSSFSEKRDNVLQAGPPTERERERRAPAHSLYHTGNATSSLDIHPQPINACNYLSRGLQWSKADLKTQYIYIYIYMYVVIDTIGSDKVPRSRSTSHLFPLSRSRTVLEVSEDSATSQTESKMWRAAGCCPKMWQVMKATAPGVLATTQVKWLRQ